jgi:hypothetical protein
MSGTQNRTTKERRTARRWYGNERRHGGDRRRDAYKQFARDLPARFLKLYGTPRERVLYLVSEYCHGCDESLQIDLAQALLPTLQTVAHLGGSEIPEEHLDACEVAVGRCVRQNELETGRWDTACMEAADDSTNRPHVV